jgi:hypothetical protein
LKNNPIASAIYASKENTTFNKGKGFSERSAIALGILEESLKQENSHWYKYIIRFPTDFSEFPAFYNEEELRMLENTSARTEIEEDKAIDQKDFDFIC